MILETPSTECRPTRGNWTELPYPLTFTQAIARSAWKSGSIRVLSELIIAELPDGSGLAGPQWLVSVSANQARPTDVVMKRVRRDFGIRDAEEDNHTPGFSRALFLCVDPAQRRLCECKITETVITEPDGYQWSNPTTGTCRGCIWSAVTGNPCTIHGVHK